jgi:hypothetical protein
MDTTRIFYKGRGTSKMLLTDIVLAVSEHYGLPESRGSQPLINLPFKSMKSEILAVP